MIKPKVFLRTLCASSLVISPLVLVLSCGEVIEDNTYETTTIEQISEQQLTEERAVVDQASQTTIKVGVRQQDVTLYQALVNAFNELGKGKVEVESMGLFPPEHLETANATGAIPTVFVSDFNVVRKVQQKGIYAKPFVANDFLKAENKDLYDANEQNVSYSEDDFFNEQLDIFQNDHGVSFGLPLGYALRGVIANTRLFDKDKDTPGIQIDYVINDYVPTTISSDSRNGKAGIKKLSGEEHQTSVKSLSDIQNYLNLAGKKDSPSDLANNWYGYGPGSMFQRIFSIGRSIVEQQNGKLDGVSIMPFKENFINYGIFTSFKENLLDKNTLTKEKFNQEILPSGKINEDLAKYMWNAFGGYMFDNENDLGFTSANLLNGQNYSTKGEVEPLMNQAALFNFNALWAANMANDGWNKAYEGDQSFQAKNADFEPLSASGEALKDGQMHIFSAPYGDIGNADYWSIAKNASAAESLVAKRFIKWLYQLHTDVTYEQAGVGTVTDKVGNLISSNFVSANSAIRLKQEEKATEKNILGFYKMGKNDGEHLSDPYNGISGSVWKSTDGTFFGDLETHLRPKMQDYYGTEPKAKTKWTYEQFKGEINQAVKNYLDEEALA